MQQAEKENVGNKGMEPKENAEEIQPVKKSVKMEPGKKVSEEISSSERNEEQDGEMKPEVESCEETSSMKRSEGKDGVETKSEVERYGEISSWKRNEEKDQEMKPEVERYGETSSGKRNEEKDEEMKSDVESYGEIGSRERNEKKHEEMMPEVESYEESSGERNEEKDVTIALKGKNKKSKENTSEEKNENIAYKKGKNTRSTERDKETKKAWEQWRELRLCRLHVSKIRQRGSEKENKDSDENLEEENFKNGEIKRRKKSYGETSSGKRNEEKDVEMAPKGKIGKNTSKEKNENIAYKKDKDTNEERQDRMASKEVGEVSPEEDSGEEWRKKEKEEWESMWRREWNEQWAEEWRQNWFKEWDEMWPDRLGVDDTNRQSESEKENKSEDQKIQEENFRNGEIKQKAKSCEELRSGERNEEIDVIMAPKDKSEKSKKKSENVAYEEDKDKNVEKQGERASEEKVGKAITYENSGEKCRKKCLERFRKKCWEEWRLNFMVDERENTDEEQSENESPSSMNFSSDTNWYLSSRSSSSSYETSYCSLSDVVSEHTTDDSSDTSPPNEIRKEFPVIVLFGKEQFPSEDSAKDTSDSDEEFPKKKRSTKEKKDEPTSNEEFSDDTLRSKRFSTETCSDDDTDTTLLSSSVPKKLLPPSGVHQEIPVSSTLSGKETPRSHSRKKVSGRRRKRYPRKQFRTKRLERYEKRRRNLRRSDAILKFRDSQSNDNEDSSELEEGVNRYSRDSSYRDGDSKMKKGNKAANKSEPLKKKDDDYCKRICGRRVIPKDYRKSKGSESVCSLEAGISIDNSNGISIDNSHLIFTEHSATGVSNADNDAVLVVDYEEVVVETDINYAAPSDRISETVATSGPCYSSERQRATDAVITDKESGLSAMNSSNIDRKSRKTKIGDTLTATESDNDRKQKKAKTEDFSDKMGNDKKSRKRKGDSDQNDNWD